MIAEDTKRRGDRLADLSRRYFLWLLLGTYAIAFLWASPGQAMRDWEWLPTGSATVPVSFPLVLLAIMLFAGAALTEVSQIRIVSHHPVVLAIALVAVWLGPSLLVVGAGWLVPASINSQPTAGILVGLALVAAMPVANSSVGWTQSAEGNLGLSLALVVLSIVLCPWVTPNLLNLLGMSLSASERAYLEALVGRFSGWFFIVWVILPTAGGFACRFLFTPKRIQRAGSWLLISSCVALLLLNYINSALAAPKIREASAAILLATALLAAALSSVGLLAGWALAWIIHVKPGTRTALMFGLSMKHTGLALTLAGTVLADQPLAILIIVLATLTQHVLAGVVQWWIQHATHSWNVAL